MSLWSRIGKWRRGLTFQRSAVNSCRRLREFVYLDDVSVYSILASRKGAIDTEFTDSQTASLNSDVGSSVGVGFAGTQVKMGSKLQTGQVQGSQVVRKAIIQTSFKQLYDLERNSLVLNAPATDCVPTVNTTSDLERVLRSNPNQRWLLDLGKLRRGELLEARVKLEAEPIFRVASVVTTLREIIENNERLFGSAITSQLPDIGALAQVLETLLVGLVPVRGRLIDYESTCISGREVLIHRSLLDQVALTDRPETCPVFVVGVAERSLFWKDIRRVLFSDGEYTVFCRLTADGLADQWRSVKVADVLGEVIPQFDDLMKECVEQARLAMTAGAAASLSSTEVDVEISASVIRNYAGLLVRHHGEQSVPDVDHLVPVDRAWLDNVDGRRSVLGEVTRYVDLVLDVETSGDVAYQLREDAMCSVDLAGDLVPRPISQQSREFSTRERHDEKFLDAEMIAIYW